MRKRTLRASCATLCCLRGAQKPLTTIPRLRKSDRHRRGPRLGQRLVRDRADWTLFSAVIRVQNPKISAVSHICRSGRLCIIIRVSGVRVPPPLLQARQGLTRKRPPNWGGLFSFQSVPMVCQIRFVCQPGVSPGDWRAVGCAGVPAVVCQTAVPLHASERLREPGGCLLLDARHDVRVSGKGHSNIPMPQPLLHDFRVLPQREQDRCGGAAQVIHAHVR
jgi:hypothetical protein